MAKRKRPVEPDAEYEKAVLYARYSSHNQKDASIEQQFEKCRELAKRQNLQIIAEYADRAISGKTDRRADFQRMMRHAEHGAFQYVIAWKSNRIGRNMLQAMINEGKLNDMGVKVLYTEEDFDDNAAGRFALRSMMNVNQFYSENMAEDITRGLEANAKECRSNGSRLIGYRVGDDGRFEVDPQGSEIVRLIFEWYNAGVTQKVITDRLNSKGFRTLHGNPFNKNSLTRILKNEKYTGVYLYKDIRIEGGMPQIIAKEVFDAVQLKLQRNQRAPAHRWDIADYLLTGKIFCGKCGAPMTGRAGNGKSGQKYDYYACSNRTRNKACDKKPVRKTWIEETVVRFTIERVLQDDIIERVADAAVGIQLEERKKSTLSAMETRKKEIDQKINNIMKAIEQGIITSTTKNRLIELEEDRAILEKEIECERLDRPMFTKEQLVDSLKSLRNGDPNSPTFQSRIIEIFIRAVYLYDDKLIVTYNFTGENSKVTLDFVNEQIDHADTLEDFEDPSENVGSLASGKCSPLDSLAPPKYAKSCSHFDYRIFSYSLAVSIDCGILDYCENHRIIL